MMDYRGIIVKISEKHYKYNTETDKFFTYFYYFI